MTGVGQRRTRCRFAHLFCGNLVEEEQRLVFQTVVTEAVGIGQTNTFAVEISQTERAAWPISPAISCSELDVIDLDLAVEGGVVHAEQLGGAALVTVGDFERATDQFDFKARDFVIERDAARNIQRRDRF